MPKKGKQIIIGPEIIVNGSIKRFEIVKKVVNTFIDFEQDKKGKGVVFKYPVENVSTGDKLFIVRPGRKKNFDFKVDVTADFGLKEGSHEQIALDLKDKKRQNPKSFEELVYAITEIYECRESDADFVLQRYPNLQLAFNTGARVEILLKVIKWLFIMEDIFYWDYEGRGMLYNALIGAGSDEEHI